MDATIEPKKTPDESFVEDAGEDVVVDRTAERRLLRKLDTVVLPLMGVSYFFGYLVMSIAATEHFHYADRPSPRRIVDRLATPASWGSRKHCTSPIISTFRH